MNHYGTMAQRHWARWLPQRYAAIQDPDSFFSALGEEVAQRIGGLMLDLAGDDPPGEDYLSQAGPAERRPQPGRGDPSAGAGTAATRAGSRGGPGGAVGVGGSARRGVAAAGGAPQPPAVGAGERRAAGTGPRQLDPPPVRSGSGRTARTILPHPARWPGSGRTWRRWPRCGPSSAMPAPPIAAEQAALARWSGLGCGARGVRRGAAGVRLGT